MLHAAQIRVELLPHLPPLLAATFMRTCATLATLTVTAPPHIASPDATCAALDLARCLLYASVMQSDAPQAQELRRGLKCLLAACDVDARAMDTQYAEVSGSWPGKGSLGTSSSHAITLTHIDPNALLPAMPGKGVVLKWRSGSVSLPKHSAGSCHSLSCPAKLFQDFLGGGVIRAQSPNLGAQSDL
jgi:hypothetical protein